MFRHIKNFHKGACLFAGIFLACQVGSVFADGHKLRVVATQTIFADITRQIGGDKVDVTAVASPKYNIHFIQPRPSDVRNIAKADLYVNAGLDLEAWSDPLLEAAGNPRLLRNAPGNVDLAQGIHILDVPDHSPTRAEGDIHLFGNPHFQMDPQNARIMAKTITEKLAEVDPVNAGYYQANEKTFLAKLEQKISEWKNLCIGCRGKEIFSYHEDIVYFADFLGLVIGHYLEPKPGIPPTPRQLNSLEDYAKTHAVKAIVLPTYYSRSAAEELAQRIGAKVVTICQGVGEVPGTDDFFSFFDHNVRQISEALK